MRNKHTKKYRKGATLSGILTAVSVIFGLLSIFVVVYIISLLWEGATAGKLILLGTTVCFCQIMKAIFYALALWKAHDFAYSSLLDIRLAVIEHLRKLPASFFQKRKTGDLANIIDRDVERIELYLAHTLPDVVITNTVCLSIFIIVTLLDWRLGIALISTLPPVFILFPLFGKLWAKSVNNYQRSIKTVSENVMEYIGSISAIKAFGNEETRTTKVLESMYEYIGTAKKEILSHTASMSLITLLMESGIVVVAITGSLILTHTTIDSWKIIVFVLSVILAGQFARNVSKFMSLNYNKTVFNSTMNTVESVMSQPLPPVKESFAEAESGDICFQNVTFNYDDKDAALKNINITFSKNSVTAVMGPSGSGKSTLANLIMGFWTPQHGQISINGKNVNDYSEQDLSTLISIVQQDTFLFNSTIEENIKMGRETASLEEIISAAKKARIHDVIMQLPHQYQTLAGESGAKLSGGEKQRISLARLILKDAPIVILDEATAAIDPHNEKLIQEAINSLCVGKTLIIIAHHLNIIASVKQIIVMQNGEINGIGTHEELMNTNELYLTMIQAEKQAEGWNIKNVSNYDKRIME